MAVVGLAILVSGRSALPASRMAVVLNLEGAIGPAGADYAVRGIRRANEHGAAVVVLRMDTPGGLDTSMREIIRAILAAPVPVLTFVAPSGARAASAGTYILYASHVAAMAPGTNLGAATPISIGGGLPLPGAGQDDRSRDGASGSDRPERAAGDGAAKDDAAKNGTEKDDSAARSRRPASAMEAKLVNDAVAYIRSLAQLRGRNADWAESAVREGESLSAEEAKARNVIDLIATSVTNLLEVAHGRTVKVGESSVVLDTSGIVQQALDPDWRTRLLSAITNPNLALILMMIGFYGLVFEFMNPGALYPGTIGAICLLLGLYALSALPLNYAGLGLIALGVALMIAEAFTPSVGILGIGGVIAFILGATILIDTDVPGFELSLPIIAGIAAAGLGFSLLVARLAWRSRRRPLVSGREGMIGERGTVLDWTGRSGRVLVAGERWKAESDASLAAGERVRVTGVDGLVLRVEPEPAAQS
jgi:membrane-bound serine protease (ClpP class)